MSANNRPVEALAEEVAVAEPEKKVWKKQPLFRIPSELGMALETYTEHGTRSKYNKHNVSFQCEVVLGPVKGTVRTCWLCGFPIQHLTLLRDERDTPVFTVPSPMLDRATCDHVLPVKLAHAILELLYITKDPAHSELLHTEYEYAHNFCNIYKSDEYFVTLPLRSRNLCNLRIKHAIIYEVLRRNFYKQRGDPNSSQYSGIKTTYNGAEITFPNLIQAYCFTSDPEAFLENKDLFFRQRWFPSVKQMIVQKIQNLIVYIKAADKCGTPESGVFYKNVPSRLLEGKPNVPKGFKGPSLHRLEGATANRARGIQRRPSFESILEALPAENRVIAFSAEPYNRYTVDITKLGPLNATSNIGESKPKATRRKKRVVFESAAAVEAEGAFVNAVNARGAGAGVVEDARGDFVEAVAVELHAEELEAPEGAAPRLFLPRLERMNNFPPKNNNLGLPLQGGRRMTRRIKKY